MDRAAPGEGFSSGHMGGGVLSVEARSVSNGDTIKGAEGAAHSADVLSLARLASLIRRLTPSLPNLSISFPSPLSSSPSS